MRCWTFVLSLLAALSVAAPALAQSPALKEAWRRTSDLLDAGKYAEAEPWAKQAVDLGRREFGVAHLNYPISLDNLGLLYDDEGRYADAEPFFKQALAIRQKKLGRDDPDIAASLNNLATLYDEFPRNGR